MATTVAPNDQAEKEAADALAAEQAALDAEEAADALAAEQAGAADARAELDAIHAANGDLDDGGLPTAADDPGPSGDSNLEIDAGGQLGWAVGGKKPTSSSLRLVGGKVDVNGQLSKGAQHTAIVGFRVGSVAFDDKIDSKTDQVTDCARNQKGRVNGVTLVPEGYRVALLPDETYPDPIDGELTLG